jgi:flavin reductase (DIM6/NTAB) family NADH-FMN oxidoreductase RutF
MVTIDPQDLSGRELSFLMTGLIVPRPIAWVSSLNQNGRANLAPHSYFNAVSSSPPVVMFSSTHSSRHHPDGRKDTLRNIKTRGEFVVSLVSCELAEAMNQTSAEVGPDIDEFTLAGLAKAPSTRVAPPRVAAARAALECRLHRTLEIGDATAVFGEVVYLHVLEGAWRDGRVDPEGLDPLSRLGGSLYASLGPLMSMQKPDSDRHLPAADERSKTA